MEIIEYSCLVTRVLGDGTFHVHRLVSGVAYKLASCKSGTVLACILSPELGAYTPASCKSVQVRVQVRDGSWLAFTSRIRKDVVLCHTASWGWNG